MFDIIFHSFEFSIKKVEFFIVRFRIGYVRWFGIKKVNKDKIEFFLDPEYLEDLTLVKVKLIKYILEKDKNHKARKFSFRKKSRR